MPENSVAVVFKGYDELSSVMKTIASSGKGLSKEYEALERRGRALASSSEKLQEKIGELSKKVISAKSDMKEAAKQFKKTGDEADGIKLENATKEYAKLSAALKEAESASEIVQKSMRNTADEMRKLFDISGKSSSGGFLSSVFGDDLGGKLAQSGILSMAGDATANLAGALTESALGQPLASLGSSIISGVASGAAAGAMAGIPGIGAAVGGAAGFANGITQIFEAEDDAFKAYVQDAFETQLSERDAALSSGSATAGGREQTLMAFSQRFGSDAAAGAFLEEVKEMARNTNYGFDEITGYSKLLLNSYNEKEVFGVLQSLSDATAGLSLNSSDVSMMISGLSRMRTTGKATQEFLGYFTERGVDTYQALSNATGADKSKITEMLTSGEISGETAAQAILDYINQTYGGLSKKLATTYDAMVDNLSDFQTDMDAAMGEGYNEGRKVGIQAQMDWMSGASGEAVMEANQAIGAWKAELENSKEQYIRDAMDAMMGTDEYQAAKEAGDAAEMGRLIMEAKVQGMNEYNASEGAQLALASERALAVAIRDDAASNSDYWDAGYEKGQWFSKGLAAGSSIAKVLGIGRTPEDEEKRTEWVTSKNEEAALAAVGDVGVLEAMGYYNKSHAFGLKYVPFDEYPALLHQGERVLTAAEARTMDRLPPFPAYGSWELSGESFNGEALGADKGRFLDDWAKGSFAFGLNAVPFDDFPALLHQGERIEPLANNRGNGDVHIDLHIDSIVVQGGGEDVVDEIVEALAPKLRAAILRRGG